MPGWGAPRAKEGVRTKKKQTNPRSERKQRRPRVILVTVRPVRWRQRCGKSPTLHCHWPGDHRLVGHWLVVLALAEMEFHFARALHSLCLAPTTRPLAASSSVPLRWIDAQGSGQATLLR